RNAGRPVAPMLESVGIVLVGEVGELRPDRNGLEVRYVIGQMPGELPPVQLSDPRVTVVLTHRRQILCGPQRLPRRDLTETQPRRQAGGGIGLAGEVMGVGVVVDALGQSAQTLRRRPAAG